MFSDEISMTAPYSEPSDANLTDWFLGTLANDLEADANPRPRHSVAEVGQTILGIEPAQHHLEWLAALEQHKRLLILAPPESAKSTWIAVAAMLAQIGNEPTSTNAIISVVEDQAQERFEVISKQIEESEAWLSLYEDVRPGAEWTSNSLRVNKADRTSPTPTLIAAGLGSRNVLGKRFSGLVVCDDLLDIENSATHLQRQKVINTFRSTILTRLTATARIAVIGTPWAKGDLYEFLPSIGFHVIKTPALREDGSSYWSAQWSETRIAEKRKEVGDGFFKAQFLLEQNLIKGSMFKREWFEIVDTPHQIIRKVRYWDLAATKAEPGKEPAWTAGALLGIDRLGTYYILDVRRARGTPGEVEHIVTETAALDGFDTPIFMEQEPGSAGKNNIHNYRRLLAGYEFRGDLPHGSKEHRAKPLSSQAEGYNVKLLRGGWNYDFLDELEDFPFGLFKDQGDAASGAFSKLTNAGGGVGGVG
jgi:predicted phage terminase large subunit-like protein